ncbi:hypothetical protein EJB05_06544, partial [Eragrostis curvula]
MEFPPILSSLLATILATALLFVTVLHRGRSCCVRKYNLPPGPRPWPVIGNLNLIGQLPHHSLHKLSLHKYLVCRVFEKKHSVKSATLGKRRICRSEYGSVMSLRLGSVPGVVGSSVEAARFFLKTHDLVFIDRPKTAAARYIMYNYFNRLWAPYGAYWRQARKLWQTELLSARRLRAQERVRAEEVRAILRGLHAASSSSSAVTIREHLLTLNLNVISRMVLGNKQCAEELKWMIEELFFLNGVVNVGDFIPWLGWLDLQGGWAGCMFDRFLEHVLGEHEERRRREGDGFVAVDVVDQLLELADDANLEVPIQRNGIKVFTLDLITAGTDPSAVTVEWAMSELLKHPEVLAKATEELDRVLGRDRLVVTEGDIPSLPYVESVVKETMRMHPVAPLLAQRLSREDTSFSGYHIPEGTRVLVNVWAIGRDPAVWDAPEEFRPERFLGSGGVDVRGHDFQLLPFGSGRRMCPGISLGLKMVHLSLANLLHAFTWRLPNGVSTEELSMEEKFGLSVVRMVPLQVVAEPKLPAHLYAAPGLDA